MSMKKAGVGFAVLVAILSIMAMGSASAMAADTVTCALTGETGSLTPPVQIQGGTGSFTFGGSAVCSVNTDPPALSTLSASGTYVNQICGTGTADGSASLNVGGGAHVYSSVGFHIDFTSSVGVVNINNGAGRGAVQISPTAPGTNGHDCTSQFLVDGGFNGTI
jgi:hypothetical protein